MNTPGISKTLQEYTDLMKAVAVSLERSRCRTIVVEVLNEEGWLGKSLQQILARIDNPERS